MRNSLLFVAVLVALGALAGGAFWLRGDLPYAISAPAQQPLPLAPTQSGSGASTAESPGHPLHDTAPADTAAEAPAPAATVPSASLTPPLLPQRVDSLHGAESAEDSDWLAANGFPDTAEFEVLMALPQSELDQLAQSGDPDAANIADYRRLRSDPASQVSIRSLFDRAVSGELFPLQLLAWHYLQQPDRESQVVASAYHRVLALRGYYNGLYSNTLIASGFTEGQRLASEVYSLVIYNDLMRARIERYGTPFPVNPRPGMEQLFAGVQAMIRETEPTDSP